MKIFYTASFFGKEQYQKSYDLVLHTLEETNVEIISPEKNNYLEVLSSKEKRQIGDNKLLLHYEAIKKGIQLADAVVIEMSQEDFQLGHEATLAIQSHKHVLCLSLHEDFGPRINNRFFHGAKYNEYTISEIIEQFIRRAQRGLLLERFNCFLSASQLHYLKSAAQKSHLNKSEYLRKLLEEDQMRGRKKDLA